MAISKKLREQVRLKFEGKCAYTGKLLDEKWQVDHVHPKAQLAVYERFKLVGYKSNPDIIENLLPAIRIVNHYKRCQDLELFRAYISTLHLRLKKLPKKTNCEKTVKRAKYLWEVALLFDINIDQPFDGVFYFEKLKENP